MYFDAVINDMAKCDFTRLCLYCAHHCSNRTKYQYLLRTNFVRGTREGGGLQKHEILARII